MEPGIHDSHVDESINPFFGKKIIDVGLAQAGADTGEDAMLKTILQAVHRFAPNAVTAAALVTHDLISFDANERRHVRHPAKALRSFIRNELTVREHLEITIGMLRQHV